MGVKTSLSQTSVSARTKILWVKLVTWWCGTIVWLRVYRSVSMLHLFFVRFLRTNYLVQGDPDIVSQGDPDIVPGTEQIWHIHFRPRASRGRCSLSIAVLSLGTEVNAVPRIVKVLFLQGSFMYSCQFFFLGWHDWEIHCCWGFQRWDHSSSRLDSLTVFHDHILSAHRHCSSSHFSFETLPRTFLESAEWDIDGLFELTEFSSPWMCPDQILGD